MIDGQLLQQLTATLPRALLTTVDVSYQGVTDDDLDILCEALQKTSVLHTFIANANRITDRGAERIARWLREQTSLERVELAQNPGISDPCIRALQAEFGQRFAGKKGLRRLALNPYRRGQAIEEREHLTCQEFLDEYVSRNTPVIVRGAMAESPACRKWSPEYFTQVMGQKEVRLGVHNLDQLGVAHYYSRIQRLDLKMHQAISLMTDLCDANALDMRLYLQGTPLDSFPEVRNEVSLPEFAARIPHTQMSGHVWVGQRDTYTPLHLDYFDNIFVQIYGDKSVVLCPPQDSKYVFQHCPDPGNKFLATGLSRMGHTGTIDPAYEAFSRATPFLGRLRAGDALFIPKAWWHEVISGNTPTISVNYWFKNDVDVMPEVEQGLAGLLNQDDETVTRGLARCVEKVLDADRPNYVTQIELTLLQAAVINDAREAVRALLSHPLVEPDRVSPCFSFTPLFLAIKFGNHALTQMLMEFSDADPAVPFACSEHTPLTLAEASGHEPIVQYLKRRASRQ